MRWIILCLFIMVIFWLALLSSTSHRESGISMEDMEEQQAALLMFEKQVECDAHSLCTDASWDGKMMADPVNSVNQCTVALERIDLVDVPDIFPTKIINRLEKFKELLRVDTQSSLEQAQEEVARRQGPKKYGFSGSFKSHPTCDAYSIIDRINKSYDVQKQMKGHYINCDVLSHL